jgi:predicted amidophosphoribosyltransferase
MQGYICPRCKKEIVETEQLSLCEICSLTLQAWAEEKGEEIKRQFFSR